MNRMKKLWVILDLIFLAVFNAVFFITSGTEHNASGWIAYGFIHFAYLMVIATPLFVRKNLNASVFGFSVCSISSAYFLAELIIGTLFILVNASSYKASLLVQLIVAGIYGIIILTSLVSNERTSATQQKRDSEIAYIKITSARLEALIGKTNDNAVARKIEKAYDLIRTSPSKSTTAVGEIEQGVVSSIDELERAIAISDTSSVDAIADRVILLSEERNRILKSHN